MEQQQQQDSSISALELQARARQAIGQITDESVHRRSGGAAPDDCCRAIQRGANALVDLELGMSLG